jgi:hypothetical protein
MAEPLVTKHGSRFVGDAVSRLCEIKTARGRKLVAVIDDSGEGAAPGPAPADAAEGGCARQATGSMASTTTSMSSRTLSAPISPR